MKTDTLDQALFLRYVRDALANLHDLVYLQTNPLGHALPLTRSGGETLGQALRQRLLQAVEALRPAGALGVGDARESLSYRVLQLSCIQSLDKDAVCHALGLGQSSFYRYHEQAAAAIASILWEEYQQDLRMRQAQAATRRLTPEPALDEAVRLARRGTRQPVSLAPLLQEVESVIRPLARTLKVSLEIGAPASSVTAYGDRGVLRQVLIDILATACGLSPGGALHLQVTDSSHETRWVLSGLAASSCPQRGNETALFAMSHALIQEYGGRLAFESGPAGLGTLRFALPMRPTQRVLIVDDDPDTAYLYQRYLAGLGYDLHVAPSVDEIETQIAQARPDIVLLDVLMPHTDGWAVLQRLKVTPETASIPVIVCSVVRQPGLALALGAARVLQKPIEEATLVAAIAAALAEPGGS